MRVFDMQRVLCVPRLIATVIHGYRYFILCDSIVSMCVLTLFALHTVHVGNVFRCFFRYVLFLCLGLWMCGVRILGNQRTPRRHTWLAIYHYRNEIAFQKITNFIIFIILFVATKIFCLGFSLSSHADLQCYELCCTLEYDYYTEKANKCCRMCFYWKKCNKYGDFKYLLGNIRDQTFSCDHEEGEREEQFVAAVVLVHFMHYRVLQAFCLLTDSIYIISQEINSLQAIDEFAHVNCMQIEFSNLH